MKLQIRKLRKRVGLTLKQLAEATGMSESYVSEIETGKKAVNDRRLDLFARALGVRVADLLQETVEDADELCLIETYRKLLPEDRAAVLRHANSLLASSKSN